VVYRPTARRSVEFTAEVTLGRILRGTLDPNGGGPKGKGPLSNSGSPWTGSSRWPRDDFPGESLELHESPSQSPALGPVPWGTRPTGTLRLLHPESPGEGPGSRRN